MLNKFKRAIKKEVVIYILMLFALTILMHSDILTHPLLRFEMMNDKENYTHPLLYTLIIYLPFLVIRKLLDFIIGLFDKR
ncbi:MAG: hypothetical protein Q9M36_14340 [Sulfurovum sp.]|nr:hypothetical protein [Sulfurovum sp.]